MVQQLLQALHALPDWNALCAALRRNEPVGVSGAAQINRSHLIAALQEELRRPALIVCQDEMAARRLQEELKAFLNEEYPLLPGRDLTFYAASAISRGWEQRRLKLLYALLTAPTTVITTWEALCLRTMPPELLRACALTVTPDAPITPEELIFRLTQSGYSRCTLVEGVG